jgi:hypothetical protein
VKDQYFGDVNDYRKYGLIRALQAEAHLRVLVAWMRTPNDGRSDGRFRSYLWSPVRWRRYDPALFDGLNDLLGNGVEPGVHLIQNTSLLGSATYFPELVPDGAGARTAWADRLVFEAAQSDLVFLDPDNGLEVPSRPFGRKSSSKYAFWHEIDRVWQGGASLLVYQHFRREKRELFIPRVVREVRTRTGGVVEAFRTPSVLFILASPVAHRRALPSVIKRVAAAWHDQIVPAGLPAV